MCGRYSLFAPPEDIEERFDATFADPFEPRYNATPRQSLPVVPDTAPETIERMEWGFVPPWAEDRSEFGFINARAETVAEKPTFRDAFKRVGNGRRDDAGDNPRGGRCLVPADGFYEWAGTDEGKQPYRVTLAEERPFAMAGLWAEWQPQQTQTGLDAFGSGDVSEDSGPETVCTFTILTTEPNDLVADLHDRMSVILPRERERHWLTESPEDIRELLGPYPAGEMQAYPVSRAINDPSNDSPAVLERADTGR